MISILGRRLLLAAVMMLCVTRVDASATPEGIPPTPGASAPEVVAVPEAPAPTMPRLESLTLYPREIRLHTSNERERIVVQAVYADGVTRDVTAEAKLDLNVAGVVRIDERHILHPVADGECELKASFGGIDSAVRVSVTEAAALRPMSFRLDVQPVLMRAGCNSGSCHGSAKGKNGFRLSLFGFDPAMDYETLTRETSARRLTTADPGASLMLQKAVTGVAHEGGMRFTADSELYKELERWVGEGARDDKGEVPRIDRVEILPKQMVLRGREGDREGDAHRITVRAFYSDGTDRDVTPLAILASMNDNSATIDEETGIVRAEGRGEASIIARYGTFAVVAQAIVVPRGGDYDWRPDNAPVNYVDELIHKKLRQMRMHPSDVCDDATFVRRVYLDIVGVLPTSSETSRFLDDPAADKRAKLVEELLARPEFPELWAMKWAEMLRIESGSRRMSYKAMFKYNTWLRDQIIAGRPMNEMVKDLITSTGGSFDNPASNFYMVETDPKLIAENVAQVFAGVRVQCAQCHNHPFERWTMDDYYSFSAFFSQIGRKKAEDPRETVIFNRGGGEVKHPVGGANMLPRVLGSPTDAEIKRGQDRREVLADWLVAPDNPWFAKVFANRVWEHFMGRGIVDPPDDVRVSNPPSNPELFDLLGEKFVASGYDLRQLVREICASRTYQLSTRTNESNEGDLTNFSHRIPRRLPAEQLIDAICQVTETPEKFKGQPLGSRSVQVADGDPGSYFLRVFGRPDRTSACTCDRRNEPTLSQALHLINGDTIAERVQAGEGRLSRLLAAEKPVAEITDELYRAAYSRPPTDEEKARAEKYVAEAGDTKQGLEDLFWAVLNSKEFMFHH